MALLVESPKHQLTCRRVKDSLAKLYNTIQTWNSLSSSSFDALNKLANVIIEEECLLATGTSISSVGETRIRLHGKIIEKREELYVQLQQLLTAMGSVVSRIGDILIGMRASVELLVNLDEQDTPLFNTLPITSISEGVEDVYQCYSEEHYLRRRILNDIYKEKDRDTRTVYLSCWLHEPCISEDMKMKLSSLLTDSGLKD
ncbi:PREDICTED: cyclin-dependent kinase 2-interacting protein-like [Amphimedon queenslandica]|uniref:Uncharacterized protein n=1 Tax=Amphimedon queenslandica TaxID=400682 RepID=A0A1X7VDW2_AMPQE|nr:PREDICTED: cyclin-dependent kinase 2-interacting protein-like [Amphimedon queenslandica]|eukprot:XP_019849500.1 PREDICTED: cyclin-dependent kinase 2-interacting protein-like [Amphimedon queenslandica]